jgi:hypothetical protein
MPFFPDTFWGLAYLAGLLAMAVAVWQWPHADARRVALLLVVHWITLRLIAATNHDSAMVWVIHDSATVVAMVIIGRCRLAYAVAALFVPVLVLDQVWLFGGSGFVANAAVAEAVGYFSMLMVAGTAHGGGKRLDAHVFGRDGLRRGDIMASLDGGRAVSGRAVPRHRSAAKTVGVDASQGIRGRNVG